MTTRQRLLTLFKGEKPDRVPWYADLDYWATGLIGRGEKPADFKSDEEYVQWHRRLNVGFYLQGYYPYKTNLEDCSLVVEHHGHKRVTTLNTPLGTLQDCWEYLPDSFSEAPIEHFIKSVQDLKVWRYYYEHMFFEPDYTFALRRQELVQQAGIHLAYLPHTPWMQLLVLDCGITALTELAFDAAEELEHTMQVMKKKLDEAVECTVRCPAEALMIPENLSSEMVGPAFFEKYVKADQTDWLKKIGSAGKYSFIHMDGSLKGLLRQMASLPVTVLEALTPAPVGDLAVGQWAEWAGNPRTILWGGLPGVYFTALIPEAEFERHVREVLEVMTMEPRYVLGVADQVPPDALEHRVRRVAELVETYGAYTS